MADEIVVQEPEKDETAIVPQFHAVAVNGTEMIAAKAGIQSWLERKLRSIEEEINSLQATYEAAVRHKWKSSGFKSQLEREKRKQLYYRKLLSACNAGFTIVPNMPCDIFAIRVDRNNPSWTSDYGESTFGFRHAAPSVPDETEQRLPVGEGRYESPVTKFHEDRREGRELKDGKEVKTYEVTQWCDGFEQIEFPLAIAHPMVMDATARAMAMKIFDRIGVVPQTRRRGYRGDPIVLGQITHKVGYETKTASFLIAWYLDPRTL